MNIDKNIIKDFASVDGDDYNNNNNDDVEDIEEGEITPKRRKNKCITKEIKTTEKYHQNSTKHIKNITKNNIDHNQIQTNKVANPVPIKLNNADIPMTIIQNNNSNNSLSAPLAPLAPLEPLAPLVTNRENNKNINCLQKKIKKKVQTTTTKITEHNNINKNQIKEQTISTLNKPKPISKPISTSTFRETPDDPEMDKIIHSTSLSPTKPSDQLKACFSPAMNININHNNNNNSNLNDSDSSSSSDSEPEGGLFSLLPADLHNTNENDNKLQEEHNPNTQIKDIQINSQTNNDQISAENVAEWCKILNPLIQKSEKEIEKNNQNNNLQNRQNDNINMDLNLNLNDDININQNDENIINMDDINRLNDDDDSDSDDDDDDLFGDTEAAAVDNSPAPLLLSIPTSLPNTMSNNSNFLDCSATPQMRPIINKGRNRNNVLQMKQIQIEKNENIFLPPPPALIIENEENLNNSEIIDDTNTGFSAFCNETNDEQIVSSPLLTLEQNNIKIKQSKPKPLFMNNDNLNDLMDSSSSSDEELNLNLNNKENQNHINNQNQLQIENIDYDESSSDDESEDEFIFNQNGNNNNKKSSEIKSVSSLASSNTTTSFPNVRRPRDATTFSHFQT